MSLPDFTILLQSMMQDIETKNECMACIPSSSTRCAQVPLELNFKSSYGISTVESYKSVWKVADAINARYTVDGEFQDEDSLFHFNGQLEAKALQNILRAVVGVLDGCLIFGERTQDMQFPILRDTFVPQRKIFSTSVRDL